MSRNHLVDAEFAILSFSMEGVEGVLDALGHGAGAAADEANGASSSDDSAFEVDASIESLFGAAFVVLQTCMTRVVSSIVRIRQSSQRTALSDKKKQKLRAGLLANHGAAISTTGVRAAEAIDALANYFKHESEWDRAWRRSRVEKRTQKIVKKLGIQGGRHALRAGAAALGCVKFEDMRVLANMMLEWRTAVTKAEKARLGLT